MMMNQLNIAIKNKTKVVIITRPPEDFKSKDTDLINETLVLLKESGAGVILKSNFHQKFAIIDKKIVWYGSINLLSFGSAEESIMRLESSNIANELIKCIRD